MTDCDMTIYEGEIRRSNNNELTTGVAPSDSPAECFDKYWLTSIRVEECDSSTTPTKHKIQKVHQVLRQMDGSSQKSYEPKVISIGPYHHGKKELNAMEKLKIRLMWDYVNSCGGGTSAELIYNKIAGLADEAKKCYADDDEGSMRRLDDIEFARMMFVDGCFLLQFIFCSIEGEKGEKEEKLKLKTHDIAYIQQDLFLLENQLPFMVLKALMSFSPHGVTGLQKIKQFILNSRKVNPPPKSYTENIENCIVEFRTFIANQIKITFGNKKNSKKSKGSHEGDATVSKDDEHEPAHLLELMRREIIDPNAFNVEEQRHENYSFWYSYRSVQELKTAGIIFRPNKSRFLTDVSYEPLFARAVLRLPVMTIDDSTKPLLLNLVAYEMCPDSPKDFGVSSYLWLIDMLIDHPDDVKELRRNGILLNVLASDEQVAKLFNEIADNLVPNPNAYANVKSQIENHYKDKGKVWLTEFLHTHFATPWTILAFIGATIALILSFIQSYYSIKQSH